MRRLFVFFLLLFLLTVPVSYCCAADESPATTGSAVQFKNSSAIFPPQHPVLLNVTLPSEEGKHLTISVFRTEDFDTASTRHKTPLLELKIQVPPQEPQTPLLPIPVSFLAPQDEGNYTVSVKFASTRSGLIQNPFQRREEFLHAETTAQFIVLDPKSVQRSIGTIETFLQHDLLEAEETISFPWQRHLSAPVFPKVANISVPKLPELPKWYSFRERPANSSQNVHRVNAESGLEIESKMSEATLTLPIKEPGKAYLLETEYQVGIPQKVEIRIEEPSTEPIVSGINVVKEIAAEPPNGRTAKHRLIFYPKTKQVLARFISKESQQNKEHENIRKVRLYRLDSDSSHTEFVLPKPFTDKAQRRILGYIRHPDDWKRNIGTDSWNLTNAKRFTELLQHGGYSGMMLGVLSDHSVLYPSQYLSSQRQNTAQNTQPPAQDTLELLAQLFDREDLTLIPALNFNRPLPSIEKLLHDNPAMSSELLVSVYVPDEKSPAKFQYNLLHPAVQNAMSGIIQEILQRYSKHPSFGGIAVQLNSNSYAQLPLFLNAVDDLTFQEFHNAESKNGTVSFPSDIEQWNTDAKARLIQSEPKIREAWMRWRIQKTTAFYHRLAKIVTEYRPDVKFYLVGSEMLDSPELQSYTSPALPRQVQPLQLIRSLGIDPRLLNELPSCVFLRPVYVSSSGDSPPAMEQEFNTFETGASFVRNGINPGTLFDHQERSAVPAEYRSRRRFVRQLAQFDTEIFIDGGSFLPLGEELFLHDFTASFRQLPPIPFQTFQPQNSQQTTLQPVTVRYLHTQDKLFVYLVNDAPFGVAATLTFSSTPKATLKELSGRRVLEPMSDNHWTVSLQPYDFIAVTLNDPKAFIRNIAVHRPATICGQGGLLEQKVHQLAQRIHVVQGGVVWNPLENPDFEVSSQSGVPSGWSADAGVTVRSDTAVKYSGNTSLQLSASDDKVNNSPFMSGWIRSNSFELPPTGKLYLSLYLGIPAGTTLPRLEAVIAEKPPASVLTAFATSSESKILTDVKTQPVLPDGNHIRWHRVFVSFDKIAQRQSSLSNPYYLAFRLLEPGTVWLDDVSFYQFVVNSAELKELQRIMLAAGERQRSGRVSDLLSILESYWVQFLYRYVPVPSEPIPSSAATVTPKVASERKPDTVRPESVPKKETSLWDRFKSWNPFHKE